MCSALIQRPVFILSGKQKSLIGHNDKPPEAMSLRYISSPSEMSHTVLEVR